MNGFALESPAAQTTKIGVVCVVGGRLVRWSVVPVFMFEPMVWFEDVGSLEVLDNPPQEGAASEQGRDGHL